MEKKAEKAHKAYKFRIYPNAEQKVLFAKTFGCVRFVYNQMLADTMEHYEKTGKRLRPTPAPYKKDYLWLKEVDSLALVNAQNHLNLAWDRFFSKTAGHPNFKSKHSGRHSYTTNLVNGNIKLLKGAIQLPKVGVVRIRQHRAIPEGYVLKSATVSRTSSGKYFVSVLFEYESQVPNVIPEKYIGLDFSVSKLFVSSEPELQTEECFLKNYRKSRKKLAKEQRILSRRKRGSNRYEKQRQNVARLHEKVANQRKDYQQKMSTKIADQYDVVCVENLSMKEVTDMLNCSFRKGMGKYVLDNGWYKFTRMLAYKLADRGKYLVEVESGFPSSQLCSECGHIKTDLTLADRSWTCPECGTHHDRDINAAINLKQEGKRLLSA